jgi:hypothetical protein
MNDQPKPYDTVLAGLRAQRDLYDKAIEALEAVQGGAISIDAVLTNAAASGGASAPHKGEIASGTFHGMNIETAVKKLLQIRKRTLTAQEIVSDLSAGGLTFQSETPGNTVTSVLTRAFKGGSDIVRVKRGIWGLQEWYPNQRFNRGGAED